MCTLKKSNVKKKLDRRIESYDQTVKKGRGKWTGGYKKPGSMNPHKQG